jgi:hypothetical protein
MEVIEEQLIKEDEGGGHAAKRHKREGASVSHDVALWIELARYSSISPLSLEQF